MSKELGQLTTEQKPKNSKVIFQVNPLDLSINTHAEIGENKYFSLFFHFIEITIYLEHAENNVLTGFISKDQVINSFTFEELILK